MCLLISLAASHDGSFQLCLQQLLLEAAPTNAAVNLFSHSVVLSALNMDSLKKPLLSWLMTLNSAFQVVLSSLLEHSGFRESMPQMCRCWPVAQV